MVQKVTDWPSKMRAERALLFVIIFAVIGGVLIMRSFAATTVGTLEAENLVLSTGAPTVISDGAASSGKAIKLVDSSPANGTLSLSGKATDISIRARGSGCGGSPTVSVSIDGKQAILATVSATSWTNYTATTAVTSGGHSVAATFTNPYTKYHGKKTACQRVLYLDILTAVDNSTTPPADTTSPTVSITSPTAGATVSGVFNVAATASDNIAVSKVEFYVDSVLASSSTASPYGYSWDTVKAPNGSHTLVAKAYDTSNNVGTSSSLSVTVSNSTTGGTGTSPSGVPLPLGDVASGGHTWRQIFAEDFTKDAALGSWGSDCSPDAIVYTGTTGTQWRAYPKCYLDTNQKRPYRSDAVLSVHDGSLDFWLHTVDGKPAGANPSPLLPGSTLYQTYGRYTARFRTTTTNLSQFYTAWLLWPQDESKWQCAESDYPEGSLGSSSFNAFAHYGCTGSQDYYPGSADRTTWHTFTQEWMPGKRNYYLDNTLIGTSTNQVYSAPERWQLQTETNTNCDTNNTCTQDGHLLVDWVAVYAY